MKHTDSVFDLFQLKMNDYSVELYKTVEDDQKIVLCGSSKIYKDLIKKHIYDLMLDLDQTFNLHLNKEDLEIDFVAELQELYPEIEEKLIKVFKKNGLMLLSQMR